MGNAALRALISIRDLEICGVFAQKPSNMPFPFYPCRSLNEFAASIGVALYEGLSFKDIKTIELIKSLKPDLIVVGSFAQIIPASIIEIPQYGVVNLHPSLLPRYRGPTPIRQVLMMGERETGVTLSYIDDETIDAGKIIYQSSCSIALSDNAGKLREKLDALGEEVLLKALPSIFEKNKNSFPSQDESEASYFSRLKPDDYIVDLNQPLDSIVNKVRALSPYPLARLMAGTKEYRPLKATALSGKPQEMPSEGRNEIIVEAKGGWLRFDV